MKHIRDNCLCKGIIAVDVSGLFQRCRIAVDVRFFDTTSPSCATNSLMVTEHLVTVILKGGQEQE
jgi:hypothetical protein